MRIIVFAAMACWMSLAAGMDTKNLPLDWFWNESDRTHFIEKNKPALCFIKSSNQPLSAAIAIDHCMECETTETHFRHAARCTTLMAFALNIFESKLSYWKQLKLWWRGTIDDDLLYATWNAATYEIKSDKLALILRRFPQGVQATRAGRPVLFHAVIRSNLAAVRELLWRGADSKSSEQGRRSSICRAYTSYACCASQF